MTDKPDAQHDIRSTFGGSMGEITIRNLVVNDSHSVNVDVKNGRVDLSCNDCDYTWAGEL